MPKEISSTELAGDRIYKIIVQSITHIKILAALEEFKRDDWEGLKKRLQPLEYLSVVYLCRKYLKCENLPVPCEEQNRFSKRESDILIIDAEISSVVQHLSKNKAASEYCLSFPVSSAIQTFLKILEEFSLYTKERINRTPEMEKTHIASLKELYNQNLEYNEKISRYQRKIEVLEQQHQDMMAAKEKDLTKHMYEIESLKNEFRETIREKIQDSEEQMILDWKSSEFRQVELIQEVKTQSAYVENQVKERLAKEKELRGRRYKVESQLVAILEQYDNDIGDRQRQREELVVQLEEGRLELEQLEERYNAQELEYRQLTTDRENYDQRRFNEKIFAIRQQIAARVIQRAFRKYMRHKYGKKKMKKLAKGGGYKKPKKAK